MQKTFYLLPLLLIFSLSAFSQSFTGYVKDSSSTAPIPDAQVYLVELQTGTSTDGNGLFALPTNIAGRVHIQISCVGYETAFFTINFSEEKEKTFLLAESHIQLSEVVVSASAVKLQQDNIVSVVQKNVAELFNSGQTSLSEAISKIPGVENYSTGSGIGKPVIRGLTGNRIVVYAQNVRVENQQWGDEHGLGIGEVGIKNVEIIKGAASLLYGSDALGGVLYFVDEPYAHNNSIEGFASTKFLSNTLGTLNDVGIKLNKSNFKMNLFGSYHSHADYQLPNFDRALNTRFNEANIKANLGYNYRKWIGNLRYSYLQSNLGITEMDTISKSIDRRAELPFQKVDNHLLSFENIIFLNKTKLNATIGYSQNNRKEFEDDPNTANLNLVLNTLSYNIKSTTPFLDDRLSFIAGIQGMYQQNSNKAEELLIPDASIYDIGAFTVLNYTLSEKAGFEGGVRYDNRFIATKAMHKSEIAFPALNRSFGNFNFAIGNLFHTKNFLLRSNIASGFRAPNTSELLSNGVHEGTLRYEIGNSNLKSEQATQIDINAEYENEHFSFFINPYFNHINNFIYLSPSDTTIDDVPVFYYRQTKANLYGGEVGIHWHPHPLEWLHIESSYSSVFAADKSGNALPLMPANKIQTTLKGEFNTKGKWKVESVFIEHVYRLPQNRIAIYETTSPSYHVLNAGIVLQINTQSSQFEMTTGINNLLNSKYIDHLSRFKEIGIDNSGLNVYVGMKWTLKAKDLKKQAQ